MRIIPIIRSSVFGRVMPRQAALIGLCLGLAMASDGAAAKQEPSPPASPEAALQQPQPASPDPAIAETAPQPPPQLVAEAGRLQFNFRQQKWDEVLDWFARQAGMSLVMNQVPPGEFTYASNTLYSAPEAIDLLNSVLLTKGFTLVRRDKMLIVLDTKQGVPYEMVPQVALDDLDQYGRFELVSVVFPLGNRPADGATEEIKAMLGSMGRAVAMPQTRQLMVTETAGRMRAIAILVEAIPEPKQPPAPPPPDKPQPPELRIYSTIGLDASATLATLKELIPGVNATADALAGQVSVYATPAQHQALDAALKQMLANRSDELRPRLEIYSLVAPADKTLLEQLANAAPQAKVTSEPERRRLLVFADQQSQQRIREVIEKLTAIGESSSTQTVRIFTMPGGDVAATAELIRAVFDLAQVIEDASGRRIIVRGSSGQLELIASLLEEIEQTDVASGPVSVKLYPLRASVGQAAQSLLAELVPQARLQWESQQLQAVASAMDQARIGEFLLQWSEAEAVVRQQRQLVTYSIDAEQAATVQGVIAKLAPQATLQWDADNNRLLATADLQDHQAISDALRQLGAHESSSRLVRLYEVEQHLQSLALEVLKQRWPNLSAEWSAEARRLLINGTLSQHEQIAALLSQLAADYPARLRTWRSYSLNRAQQQSLDTVLGGLGDRFADVQVAQDPTAGRVTIVAQESQHVELANIIASLVEKPGLERVLRAYSLNQGDAAATATILRLLFPDAIIHEATESSKLIVWAVDDIHVQISEALSGMLAGEDQHLRELRVFPALDTDPATLASLLGPQFPGMKLQPDATKSKLLAWGSPQQQELLQGVLGTASETARSVRVYPTGRRDPLRLRELLAGVAPRAVLTADAQTIGIVALATDEDHAQLKTAVDQLLRGGEAEEGRRLETYELPKIGAAAALPILNQLTPSAELLAGPQSTQIAAWASEADHAILAAAVTRLEQGEAIGGGRELKLHEVRPHWESDARAALAAAAPDAEVLGTLAGEKLMVWAAPADHAVIAKALEQLRAASPEPEGKTVAAYVLGDLSPTQARSALAELVGDLRMLDSPRTDRIVVWGTAEVHQRVAQQLRQLEESLGQAALQEATVVTLERLNPIDARKVLAQLVADVTIVDGSEPRQILVAGDAELQRRAVELLRQLDASLDDSPARPIQVYPIHQQLSLESLRSALQMDSLADISVISDATGHSLIVRATSEQHQQIASMLQSMADKLSVRGLVTRVYPASASIATDVGRLLTGMFPNSRLASNPGAGAVAATATAEDHERIAEIIQAFNEGMRPQGQTRVFQLAHGSPAAIADALRETFPDARFGVDEIRGALVVSADDRTLTSLDSIMKELDVASADQRLAKNYRPRRGGESIYETLSGLYTRRDNVRIAFDAESNTLTLVAPAAVHQSVQQMIEEFEKLSDSDRGQSMQSYDLGDAKGQSIAEMLAGLFEEPKPKLVVEPLGNQLLALATEEQHQRISEVLDRFGARRRGLEVFQLQRVDSFTAQSAIESLFADSTQPPTIDSDPTTSLLVVRGDPEQLQQIRELLTKMGEPDGEQSQDRRRSVPVQGDPLEALRQLEQLWPQLRQNPLRISPALLPPAQTPSPQAKDDGAQGAPDAPDAGGQAAGQVDCGENALDESTPSCGGQEPPAEPSSNEQQPATQPQPSEAPPIVVTFDGEQIILTSDDPEALAQCERLLRQLLQQVDTGSGGAEFVIVPLRNADAAQIQQVVDELARRLRLSPRTSLTRSVAVADGRLNALVVFGSRNDREVLVQLVRSLDDAGDTELLMTRKPRLVHVRHSPAEDILRLLRTVYQPQLTTGGGRRALSIPEGVSREVASVLQEINAASAGPLMTLDTDPATNSIVVTAPSRLSLEVIEFINQLDHSAEQSPARTTRLIHLEGANIPRIEKALQMLMQRPRNR